MARHAGRARQVVVIVDVAIRAGARRHRVRTRQGESGGAVVEGRARPVCRAVALIAGLREVGRHVVRIGRALVILQMAGHAGCAVQAVVIVDVAIGAGPRRNCVHAGQRESSRAVVESRARPVRSAVALIAGLWKARRDVVRIRRALVILQMAGHAGSAIQAVIVIRVAVRAHSGRHRVHAGQRESGRGMIERTVGPLHRVMAILTSSGEPDCGVSYRAGRVVVIGLMA